MEFREHIQEKVGAEFRVTNPQHSPESHDQEQRQVLHHGLLTVEDVFLGLVDHRLSHGKNLDVNEHLKLIKINVSSERNWLSHLFHDHAD